MKNKNSHFYKWLFLFFISIIFKTSLANSDSVSTTQSNWNIALGFDLTGWHMNIEGRPNEYFMSYGFFPKVGYFANENFEFGLLMESKLQRTNLEKENNETGVGGGYYIRYNFTQFDPIRSLFKSSSMVTTFHLEWEHLFSNYRFMDINERYPDRELYNMTMGDRNVYHHFMPKIGLRIKVYEDLFFNLQVLYRQVNADAVDVPIRWRASFEYSF